MMRLPPTRGSHTVCWPHSLRFLAVCRGIHESQCMTNTPLGYWLRAEPRPLTLRSNDCRLAAAATVNRRIVLPGHRWSAAASQILRRSAVNSRSENGGLCVLHQCQLGLTRGDGLSEVPKTPKMNAKHRRNVRQVPLCWNMGGDLKISLIGGLLVRYATTGKAGLTASARFRLFP